MAGGAWLRKREGRNGGGGTGCMDGAGKCVRRAKRQPEPVSYSGDTITSCWGGGAQNIPRGCAGGARGAFPGVLAPLRSWRGPSAEAEPAKMGRPGAPPRHRGALLVTRRRLGRELRGAGSGALMDSRVPPAPSGRVEPRDPALTSALIRRAGGSSGGHNATHTCAAHLQSPAPKPTSRHTHTQPPPPTPSAAEFRAATPREPTRSADTLRGSLCVATPEGQRPTFAFWGLGETEN